MEQLNWDYAVQATSCGKNSVYFPTLDNFFGNGLAVVVMIFARRPLLPRNVSSSLRSMAAQVQSAVESFCPVLAALLYFLQAEATLLAALPSLSEA